MFPTQTDPATTFPLGRPLLLQALRPLTMTPPTHAALLATLLTSLFFLVSALVAVGLLIEKIILWLDMLTGLEVLPLTKYVPAMVRFSNY